MIDGREGVSLRFHAHSSPDPSRGDWQPLRDHLAGTASAAARAGARIGIADLAGLAGWLHDLGKYDPDFQRRLDGAKESVEHSIAGAWYVLRQMRFPPHFRELVAHAIAGHHAGLPDRNGAGATLDNRVGAFAPTVLDPAWVTEVQPEPPAALFSFAPGCGAPNGLRFALLGRMIFSCLVDADYRDTEAYYDGLDGRRRDRSQPALADLLPRFLAAFDAHVAALAATKRAEGRFGAIDALRAEILSIVLARAGDPAGPFTLTIPTGGGKTLASLGFALRHALAHGLDRIIYVCPYTSIIDQTADVFRKVLGDDAVLEHHSAIDDTREVAGAEKLRLAMEDWSAPVIVTTSVQFFESLFADRPSACRKLHNIARSVVILDEAQTLPRPLFAPAVSTLEALAADWGCSLVLCTATQPALVRSAETMTHPAALPLAGRELAPDPAGLAARLKRVRLVFAGPMTDDDLVGALAPEPQALVIVNSRGHALSLYRAAEAAGLDGLVHLTTRQCAVDRRILLAEIRARLKDGRPCRVIATSLVEAGVDLDFPRVWRAAAGLDQIAQAAGRCNREGRRAVETSVVTVFEPDEHPGPKELVDLHAAAARAIRRIGGSADDLFAPAAMTEYFREVYWQLGDGLDKHRIVLGGQDALLRASRTQTDLAYRTVAEKFRMIESGMEPVIVPIDERSRRLIEDLAIAKIPSGALARSLQGYTVQVPPMARRILLDRGHVAFAAPKLRGEQFAVLRYGDLYEQRFGLLFDDPDYMKSESAIF